MRPGSLLSRLRRRVAARARSSSSSQQATFTAIFKSNAWGDAESVSGHGSSQARGADFQSGLLSLLNDWCIRSIVDAPCGDFNWMRNVLSQRDIPYTGIDIVDELISANNRAHAGANRRFLCADMTRVELRMQT